MNLVWLSLLSWHVNLCRLFNAKSCLYIYEVHTISFQTFFVRAFKIVRDTWKFTMLLLYILRDDWPIFMISRSNEQLQQQLEYSLLKPGCHSWCISKMQSDTLEERYTIRFCFKLGKSATETYGMLQTPFRPSCMNRASVFECHKRFKEGRDDERGGRSKEVNTPELIGQRVRFKVRTLQIGSVAFPPGPCTSPQLHPCHRLFDQDGHQDSRPLLPLTFAYSLSSEAIVMIQLRRWKRLWRMSLCYIHTDAVIKHRRTQW